MGFVNEFIPAEDVEKYNIKEIDKKFVPGTKARDWTIDRERDIYLRNVSAGGGNDVDAANQKRWTFYWHGDALTLRMDLMGRSGVEGEPGWAHWKLIWLNGSNGLPMHLKPQKALILETLKEALVAHQGGGLFGRLH